MKHFFSNDRLSNRVFIVVTDDNDEVAYEDFLYATGSMIDEAKERLFALARDWAKANNINLGVRIGRNSND